MNFIGLDDESRRWKNALFLTLAFSLVTAFAMRLAFGEAALLPAAMVGGLVGWFLGLCVYRAALERGLEAMQFILEDRLKNRFEQSVGNHEKHYRGLVHYLRSRGEGPYDLAEIFCEGSTVAHEIWRRHGGEEGDVKPDHICPKCDGVIHHYNAFCPSCGVETGIEWD